MTLDYDALNELFDAYNKQRDALRDDLRRLTWLLWIRAPEKFGRAPSHAWHGALIYCGPTLLAVAPVEDMLEHGCYLGMEGDVWRPAPEGDESSYSIRWEIEDDVHIAALDQLLAHVKGLLKEAGVAIPEKSE